MERAVAIKKLGALLGKSLGYRVNNKAPNADERVAAKAGIPVAFAERDHLDRLLQERRRAILAADQEYQTLRVRYAAAKKLADELSSAARSYKFTVGISSGMFFHVKAEGDSWEDVIEKVRTAK